MSETVRACETFEEEDWEADRSFVGIVQPPAGYMNFVVSALLQAPEDIKRFCDLDLQVYEVKPKMVG